MLILGFRTEWFGLCRENTHHWSLYIVSQEYLGQTQGKETGGYISDANSIKHALPSAFRILTDVSCGLATCARWRTLTLAGVPGCV